METQTEIRRANMALLVQREGLSSFAKRVGKPDSQISDMLAGRKSFGEKVARAIEQKYAPERPVGWLDIKGDSERQCGTGKGSNLLKKVSDNTEIPDISAFVYLWGLLSDADKLATTTEMFKRMAKARFANKETEKSSITKVI